MQELTKPKLDGTTRVTGRHLDYLGGIFNGFEIQLLTGIFRGEISRLTSEENLDLPIDDPCVCFVIRTLIQEPGWAPLIKLKNHNDLMEKLELTSDRFPFSTDKTHTGVLIGKSAATSYNLSKHRTSEMFSISIWITILFEHWRELNAEGKDHFIYQLMEDEAYSRGLNGLTSVTLSRGWPKALPEQAELIKDIPAINGHDLKRLINHRRTKKDNDDKIKFDHTEMQYLLGAFMNYITTAVTPANIDLPLTNTTRSLIIRYLQKHPEKAPLPKLYDFQDLVTKLAKAEKTHPGQFPFPPQTRKLGVLLGRGVTTMGALQNSSRKHKPSLATWITILVNQFDDLILYGKNHMIRKVVEEEAKSRNLTLGDVILHTGWPKSE